MLVLVALAVAEELLWDALVFRDYLPALCRNMTAAPPAGEAATHGGLHLSSRFGGRAFELTDDAGERSARRGGGWLCDRLWGEEEGDASVEGDEGGGEGGGEGELPLLDLGATGVALCTAALATPQIVHYVLDGCCWRLDRSPHQPRTARHHPRGATWPVTYPPPFTGTFGASTSTRDYASTSSPARPQVRGRARRAAPARRARTPRWRRRRRARAITSTDPTATRRSPRSRSLRRPPRGELRAPPPAISNQ